MLWTLLTVLLGCQYFEEQRAQPTTVSWDGYVLAQVADEADARVMDSGRVALQAMDGSFELEAIASTTTAGYWRFDEVPVATEVAVILEGPEGGSESLPELAPTVWRGITPSGRASWLTGGLFLRDLDTTEAFLQDLTAFDEVEAVTPLIDGTVAHLWGEPWEPEAWVGARLGATGGDGAEVQVLALAYAEDGTLGIAGDDDPIDLFVALELEPGEVELEVEASDGSLATTTWPARGGDLLSAIYLALPEDAP